MWVMIITFLMYGSPAEFRFSANVTSVEFSSKSTCENARAEYLKDLDPITKELRGAIEDKNSVGEIQLPAGVIISALCVAK